MRQALWLLLLFLVTSSFSLGITYYVARDSQERAIEDTLVQDMVGFRATPSAAALAVLVNAQTSQTDPQRRLLSYQRPGGRVVAGNASITQQSAGLRLVVLGADPTPVQGPFMLLSEQIHGGLLTLAQSAKPLQELRDTFLRVFLFSLLPTVAIALFGGVLLARRSARALSDLDQVLSRLTSGDLTARAQKSKGPRDDLGRIGDSVNRMAQAQEQSMVALKQVSADIAHDLKSPIQRVAVQLEQLHHIKDLPPQARSIAKEAVAETGRIVETFQSLLQIAQLEGSSPRTRFQPVDLGALARTFVEIYQPSAEEEGRRLTLTSPSDPVWVLGDKGLMGQLLANLVENALRHTPKGSDISVLVEAGNQPALAVRDHGPGIVEAEQKNVFRRLYRLEQSRTTPGSGLGLSLVQAIADLHCAEISLRNAGPGLWASVLFANAPLAAKDSSTLAV